MTRYSVTNFRILNIGTKNGYPESTKEEALIYYTKGLGFRQIKIDACKSRNSNKLGKESSRRAKESRRRKKVEKEIEVIELDEMCIILKNIWIWTAVDRENKKN